jgi:1-aminocyclopropane-1-carboxylate deaminase/D-cysteine desulfhydrase-like pyridoxal-dependent ACC family enzyme
MFARAKVDSLTLGQFPTPVERLETLSTSHCDLWVKRDDLTHAVYGGNKVRKLERVLASATAAGVTRIVTVGAAGSHHVLATTYFAPRAGFAVEAVLVPQPRTSHVVDVLRADIALGLRAFAVRSWARAPFAVARRVAAGARFVTVGGSSLDGAMGYVDAAFELGEQVRSGAMPEPDLCVVALGSGGTAAGLAAGFLAQGMKTRVVAVCVSEPIALVRMMAYGLAWGCARRAGVRAALAALRGRIAIDPRFLGRGYGYATPQGEAAMRAAVGAGLALDQTYTAKTFACALANVQSRPAQARCVLYWHTLSSAPLQPLLVGAPSESELDPALRRLIR